MEKAEEAEEEAVEWVAVMEVEWLRVVRDFFAVEKRSTLGECLGEVEAVLKPADSQSVSF